MTLREALERISTTYEPHAVRASAKLGTISNYPGHPLASFIRSTAIEKVVAALGKDSISLSRKGSPGQDDWANVPWLAVYDPLASSGAMDGYYIVYLFDTPNNSLYLSLNQGTYSVDKEYKSQASAVLTARASTMRSKILDFEKLFPETNLQFSKKTSLTRNYSAGHVLGKRYDGRKLPNNTELEDDLQQIVRMYRTLIFRGGPLSIDDEAELPGPKMTVDERRRYRLHKAIERNQSASKKVKTFHGYVCKCCNFDFHATYGSRGEEYIEAHHIKPLSTLPEDEAIAYDIETDFTVLCSNCHRMVHRYVEAADIVTIQQAMKTALVKTK